MFKLRKNVSLLVCLTVIFSLFAFTGGNKAFAAGPAGYTFCSNEDQKCNFTGSASIAFGANGSYHYLTLTSITPCNNTTFSDPIPGTAKASYYLSGGATPTPTPTSSPTATPTPTPTPSPTAPPTNVLKLEAESYSTNSGVSTRTTTDTGGGSQITSLDTNDYMVYSNVNLGTGYKTLEALQAISTD